MACIKLGRGERYIMRIYFESQALVPRDIVQDLSPIVLHLHNSVQKFEYIIFGDDIVRSMIYWWLSRKAHEVHIMCLNNIYNFMLLYTVGF